MKHIKAIILMLLTSVICFTYFSVYAETNTLKAGILDDYSFDGNSISEYAEDSVNTILDTTASTNFIANEINFDDTTFNKGISDLQSGNIDFLCMVPVSDAFFAYVDYTSSPIATGFLGLYTTDYKQLYFEEFDTFNKIKIGLLKNSYIEKILSDFSAANNFTYIPVYYDTVDDMLNAVKNNSIDAIFTPTTNSRRIKVNSQRRQIGLLLCRKKRQYQSSNKAEQCYKSIQNTKSVLSVNGIFKVV